MTSNDLLSRITEINIDDLVEAWGLSKIRFGRGLVRALARPVARNFARDVVKFNHAVHDGGLKAGGMMLCSRYTRGVRASGLKNVPGHGPLLIVSNHPGLCDTPALFAAIPRKDLRAITIDRPFIRALPGLARYFYMLPEDAGSRAGVIRSAARHLDRGGALLSFPAGRIEPDPAAASDAAESLAEWSRSIGVFTRLAPDLRIVVVMIEGVFNPAALRHPLTHLRRGRKNREHLAAALQIIWKPFQKNIVSLKFSAPLEAGDLLTQTRDRLQITRLVTETAKTLLSTHIKTWQTILPVHTHTKPVEKGTLYPNKTSLQIGCVR